MRDAIAAELMKQVRLRASWLLVWIYPLALLVIAAIVLLHGLTTARPPAPPLTPAAWIDQSAIFWNVPLSTFGRYLIASFAVFAVASEYGWNTWKLIVPTRARWQLMAAKWVAILALLLTAFLAADLVVLVSNVLNAAVIGPAAPPALAAATVASSHAAALGSTLVPTIYTVALGVLFSVVTRSTLAAVLLSVALITAEQMLPFAATLLHGYAPAVVEMLLQALPFFHVGNLVSWGQSGAGLVLPLAPGTMFTVGWAQSLAIALGWTAILWAATVILFGRQDMN